MDNKQSLSVKMTIAALVIGAGLIGLSGAMMPAPVANLLWLIKVILIVLIIREGTLFSSGIFWSLLAVSFAVITTGSLLKIMHWPGANSMLILGLSAPVAVYGFRYLAKEKKKLFDLVKYIFVAFTFIASLFKVMHWSGSDMYLRFSQGMLIALAACYLHELLQRRKEKETAEGIF